jgi:membrane-bound metal-dependent hydrolase YbcI (DUF457 family)
MPSTVVHVGFALLLAAGLLRSAYDRRALAVVVVVVVLADLDVFTSLVVEGSHRAMFHTLLLPFFVGTYLYADTRLSGRSLVRERVGDDGVRVAWVAIAAFCLAAVGLDMFTAAGVNLLYPLVDQFYSFNGQVIYSTADGVSQSFVQVRTESPTAGGGAGGGTTVDVGQKGSSQEYRVGSGVNPNRGPEPAGVERRFPVVYNGWQASLTLLGLLVTTVRLRGRQALTADRAEGSTGEVPSTSTDESKDLEATDD